MDETTVNSNMRLSKVWSYSDKPVKTIIGTKRLGGITIYGGIGNCLKTPVFTLGTSTNREELKIFFDTLK